METIQIAASPREVVEPSLWLDFCRVNTISFYLDLGGVSSRHLRNHHVAVENPLTPILVPLDAAADASHNGSADGDVGYEVPVHYVDVQPVRTRIVDNA
jgi:hypothetical protein